MEREKKRYKRRPKTSVNVKILIVWDFIVLVLKNSDIVEKDADAQIVSITLNINKRDNL